MQKNGPREKTDATMVNLIFRNAFFLKQVLRLYSFKCSWIDKLYSAQDSLQSGALSYTKLFHQTKLARTFSHDN